MVTGQEIKRSPFNVKIGPHKSTKIKAYGPGLKGGIVNKPARFTVDTCGETGALGFSIEGPSQVIFLDAFEIQLVGQNESRSFLFSKKVIGLTLQDKQALRLDIT